MALPWSNCVEMKKRIRKKKHTYTSTSTHTDRVDSVCKVEIYPHTTRDPPEVSIPGDSPFTIAPSSRITEHAYVVSLS